MRKPLRVILDSSFLFTSAQFRIDVFEELEKVLTQHFEPVVLSSTCHELEKIMKKRSVKLQRQAALAMNLAQQCSRLKVKKGNAESYDDVIVRVASKMKYCAATNDRVLRKKLRQKNVAVIYLRQKSHLAIDGYIPQNQIPKKTLDVYQ